MTTTTPELISAAYCVLAWIDRKTDTGRHAAERLERALAAVAPPESREIVAGDKVYCDFGDGRVMQGTVLRVDESQIPYLIAYERMELVRKETWADARSVKLLTKKEGSDV